MIDAIQRKLSAGNPLRVNRAEYDGYYSFVFGGDDWTVALTSPWRLLVGEALLTDFAAADAPDDVWGLIGRDLVGIGARSSLSGIDASFLFRDGSKVDVFCDNYIDPWIVYLGNQTYVATAESQVGDSSGCASILSSRFGSVYKGEDITSLQECGGGRHLVVETGRSSLKFPQPWRVLDSGSLLVSSDTLDRYGELEKLAGLTIEGSFSEYVGSVVDFHVLVSGGFMIESFGSTVVG